MGMINYLKEKYEENFKPTVELAYEQDKLSSLLDKLKDINEDLYMKFDEQIAAVESEMGNQYFKAGFKAAFKLSNECLKEE